LGRNRKNHAGKPGKKRIRREQKTIGERKTYHYISVGQIKDSHSEYTK